MEKYDFKYLMEHMLCAFSMGSDVYGCTTDKSDSDTIVIVDNSIDLSDYPNQIAHIETTYDMHVEDIQFITDKMFRKMIEDHHIHAIESMWMTDDNYTNFHYFMDNYRPLFKLDKGKLRKTISSICSNSWAKCHKKLTVEKDFDAYRAKKSLFHCFRLYDFGTQIAEHGKIFDYGSVNSLLYKILAEPDVWEILKEKYQPLLNEYHSRFVKVCPK